MIEKLQNLTLQQIEALKYEVNYASPFGPENAGAVRDDLAKWIIFNQQNAICEAYTNDPKIIVGRRGSGKTSIVSNTDRIERHSYLATINPQEAIDHIRDAAFRDRKPDQVFVETVARLWEVSLNTFLMATILKGSGAALPRMATFLSSRNIPTGSRFVAVINAFRVAAEGAVGGTGATIMRAILSFIDNDPTAYESALEEMDRFLRDTRATSVIIIDSMEDYGLGLDENRKALEGLLKCIGEYGSSNRKIHLCIPGEAYFEIRSCSSNPLKDFTRNLLLQWLPRELFGILAWRYLIYLRLYNQDRFRKFQYTNLLDRKNALAVIGDFMIPEVQNGIGFREPSIRYILRHTQLLPRQMLFIANRIYRSSRVDSFELQASNDRIVEGIKECESIIADEVFTAFKYKYPLAKAVAQRVITELPRFFSNGDLHATFNRHARRALPADTVEFEEFRRMLVEIGVIGRVRQQMVPYADAEFEYAKPGQLYLSVDDELCLHPIFSGTFSSSKNGGGGLAVHPQRDWYEFDEGRMLAVD